MGRLGDKRKQPVTQSGIHAYVCTPAYDGKVESNFSQSLAEAAFCAPLYKIRITAGVMGNGAFIDLARNTFVKKFLTEYTDTTHLFFIDSDLRFMPNAFIGLLQSGHPVCAGIYRRRQEPEEYPFQGAENPDGGGLWFVDDWLMCNRVPTGFLCISRPVLEEMAADAPKIQIHNQGLIPWVFHTEFENHEAIKALAEKYSLPEEFMAKYGKYLPTDDAKFIGEDYGFANDYLRKYKTPIPVWTNFDFTHGGYVGNMYEWLCREKDEFDKSKEVSAAA